MNMAVHYSSVKDDWETPSELFDILDAEFHFDIDVAATPLNAKCAKFYTPEDNALKLDWGTQRCFLNPPYGRVIGKWMKKAYLSGHYGALVVCLVPARVDTKWWWDYCTKGAIRFIRGRLTFSGYGTAPFPSAIVVFGTLVMPSVSWWDWRTDEYR